MTCLSRCGKKARKRGKLMHRGDPYGPLANGRHNPRLSELPGIDNSPRMALAISLFVRSLGHQRKYNAKLRYGRE